ncbi:unnamed protein product [Amoebophrya sp. A25]|nr:unnamed protein product [Amoebophrya sp. A25]|eukprot:GSA25T00024106001.1
MMSRGNGGGRKAYDSSTGAPQSSLSSFSGNSSKGGSGIMGNGSSKGGGRGGLSSSEGGGIYHNNASSAPRGGSSAWAGGQARGGPPPHRQGVSSEMYHSDYGSSAENEPEPTSHYNRTAHQHQHQAKNGNNSSCKGVKYYSNGVNTRGEVKNNMRGPSGPGGSGRVDDHGDGGREEYYTPPHQHDNYYHDRNYEHSLLSSSNKGSANDCEWFSPSGDGALDGPYVGDYQNFGAASRTNKGAGGGLENHNKGAGDYQNKGAGGGLENHNRGSSGPPQRNHSTPPWAKGKSSRGKGSTTLRPSSAASKGGSLPAATATTVQGFAAQIADQLMQRSPGDSESENLEYQTIIDMLQSKEASGGALAAALAKKLRAPGPSQTQNLINGNGRKVLPENEQERLRYQRLNDLMQTAAHNQLDKVAAEVRAAKAGNMTTPSGQRAAPAARGGDNYNRAGGPGGGASDDSSWDATTSGERMPPRGGDCERADLRGTPCVQALGGAGKGVESGANGQDYDKASSNTSGGEYRGPSSRNDGTPPDEYYASRGLVGTSNKNAVVDRLPKGGKPAGGRGLLDRAGVAGKGNAMMRGKEQRGGNLVPHHDDGPLPSRTLNNINNNSTSSRGSEQDWDHRVEHSSTTLGGYNNPRSSGGPTGGAKKGCSSMSKTGKGESSRGDNSYPMQQRHVHLHATGSGKQGSRSSGKNGPGNTSFSVGGVTKELQQLQQQHLHQATTSCTRGQYNKNGQRPPPPRGRELGNGDSSSVGAGGVNHLHFFGRANTAPGLHFYGAAAANGGSRTYEQDQASTSTTNEGGRRRATGGVPGGRAEPYALAVPQHQQLFAQRLAKMAEDERALLESAQKSENTSENPKPSCLAVKMFFIQSVFDADNNVVLNPTKGGYEPVLDTRSRALVDLFLLSIVDEGKKRSRRFMKNLDEGRSLQRLESVLKEHRIWSRVELFGSALYGLADGIDGCGDVDVSLSVDTDLYFDGYPFRERTVEQMRTQEESMATLVLSPDHPTSKLVRREITRVLEDVEKVLRGKLSKLYKNAEFVNAKVMPLLVCRDYRASVELDITVNNIFGLRTSRLLALYLTNPHCHNLARIVRRWVSSRELGDTKTGGLTSCAWLEMVIFYMQHRGLLPQLQDEENPAQYDETWDGASGAAVEQALQAGTTESNAASIAERFLDFLKFLHRFIHNDTGAAVVRISVGGAKMRFQDMKVSLLGKATPVATPAVKESSAENESSAGVIISPASSAAEDADEDKKDSAASTAEDADAEKKNGSSDHDPLRWTPQTGTSPAAAKPDADHGVLKNDEVETSPEKPNADNVLKNDEVETSTKVDGLSELERFQEQLRLCGGEDYVEKCNKEEVKITSVLTLPGTFGQSYLHSLPENKRRWPHGSYHRGRLLVEEPFIPGKFAAVNRETEQKLLSAIQDTIAFLESDALPTVAMECARLNGPAERDELLRGGIFSPNFFSLQQKSFVGDAGATTTGRGGPGGAGAGDQLHAVVPGEEHGKKSALPHAAASVASASSTPLGRATTASANNAVVNKPCYGSRRTDGARAPPSAPPGLALDPAAQHIEQGYTPLSAAAAAQHLQATRLAAMHHHDPAAHQHGSHLAGIHRHIVARHQQQLALLHQHLGIHQGASVAGPAGAMLPQLAMLQSWLQAASGPAYQVDAYGRNLATHPPLSSATREHDYAGQHAAADVAAYQQMMAAGTHHHGAHHGATSNGQHTAAHDGDYAAIFQAALDQSIYSGRRADAAVRAAGPLASEIAEEQDVPGTLASKNHSKSSNTSASAVVLSTNERDHASGSGTGAPYETQTSVSRADVSRLLAQEVAANLSSPAKSGGASSTVEADFLYRVARELRLQQHDKVAAGDQEPRGSKNNEDSSDVLDAVQLALRIAMKNAEVSASDMNTAEQGFTRSPPSNAVLVNKNRGGPRASSAGEDKQDYNALATALAGELDSRGISSASGGNLQHSPVGEATRSIPHPPSRAVPPLPLRNVLPDRDGRVERSTL